MLVNFNFFGARTHAYKFIYTCIVIILQRTNLAELFPQAITLPVYFMLH